jgi:hypothetical protein
VGQYAALARVLALLVAALGLFMSGWYVNGLRHERNALASDADRQSALSQELAKERERANGYSEQVIALLSAPKASNTIREVIRENPSKCVRPVPVTDGLRAEVDRANQAIAASRNNGVLPGNPREAK